MQDVEWLKCPLLSSNPELVSGAIVFKGTRLPVDAITSNVDAFMEIDGLSLDEAIKETLEQFPHTPGGTDSIRAVLSYREAREHQLQR